MTSITKNAICAFFTLTLFSSPSEANLILSLDSVRKTIVEQDGRPVAEDFRIESRLYDTGTLSLQLFRRSIRQDENAFELVAEQETQVSEDILFEINRNIDFIETFGLTSTEEEATCSRNEPVADGILYVRLNEDDTELTAILASPCSNNGVRVEPSFQAHWTSEIYGMIRALSLQNLVYEDFMEYGLQLPDQVYASIDLPIFTRVERGGFAFFDDVRVGTQLYGDGRLQIVHSYWNENLDDVEPFQEDEIQVQFSLTSEILDSISRYAQIGTRETNPETLCNAALFIADNVLFISFGEELRPLLANECFHEDGLRVEPREDLNGASMLHGMIRALAIMSFD